MPISNQYYYNQSIPLVEEASDLELAILEELRKITNRTIDDPGYNASRRIEQFTEEEIEKWLSNSEKWVLATLPAAYLRGIQHQDSTINRLVSNPKPPTQPIGQQTFQNLVRIDSTARVPGENGISVLSKFRNHFEHLAPLEQGAIQTFQNTAPHILRDARRKYQAIAREALEPAFRTGATATRRDLSQGILDRFAKDGIEAVEYPSGYKMSVEAYAEREARSYTGKTAMQAQSNRAMERGYDLVRITQYAGPSPMCNPYQGKVFSLRGGSEQYPALDSVIFAGSYEVGGGIYHDYCFSYDTEVFTEKGWMPFFKLDGEKILSRNPASHKLEFVDYVRFISKRYKGVMIQFTGGNVDIRVTDNHMMYATETDYAYGNVSYKEWDFELVEAKNIIGKHTFLTGFDGQLSKHSEVRKDYVKDEQVYCVTLEKNHVMLVRRKGKPIWSGNCGHSQNTYIPGQSESIPLTDSPEENKILNEMGEAKGNRHIFQQSQELRRIERQIRKRKKEAVIALNPSVRKRKEQLVRNWQARAKEHVDSNPFLKRAIAREQI